MKVLFIGGTGIISEAVSKLAIQKGMDLYLLNRGNRPLYLPQGAKVINSDIRDKGTIKEVLKSHSFDVVVDWIAFTPEHIRTDLELFMGNVGQYIFISSASAYQKPPTDYIITESTPLANPFWQYSRDKIDCEDILMAQYRNNRFPVTIVRPSLTYGLQMIPAALNSWQKPWSIVDRMQKGKKIIVHGDGTSLWTITHNTDFAKGFTGLMGNSMAVGHAFHITSDEVLTWNMIYELIGKAAGVKPDIIHIASDFISAVHPESYGSLLGDKAESAVFDNSKIKRFVPDFKATVSFETGIKRSVEWFLEHSELCTLDAEWDASMDMIINKYNTALGINK
ncbi:MAG TPA: SDR family oxidoreductase [Pseudobacteroides sp.]|uniref:SDR family oxidoreductase n=1 Tax=Pseudobacteroides sp. TaxID=1968840 RepID=UPI002F95EF39